MGYDDLKTRWDAAPKALVPNREEGNKRGMSSEVRQILRDIEGAYAESDRPYDLVMLERELYLSQFGLDMLDFPASRDRILEARERQFGDETSRRQGGA